MSRIISDRVRHMQACEERKQEGEERTLAPCGRHGCSPSSALRDPRNRRATSAETEDGQIG